MNASPAAAYPGTFQRKALNDRRSRRRPYVRALSLATFVIGFLVTLVIAASVGAMLAIITRECILENDGSKSTEPAHLFAL